MTNSVHSTSVKISPSGADASHVPPSQSTTVSSSPAVTPVKINPSTNTSTSNGGVDKGGLTSPVSQKLVTPGTKTVKDTASEVTPTPVGSSKTNTVDMDDASSTSEAATSILLGVQALERQQQQKQYALEALGVLALERQQAEVEARRRRSNSLSKSLTAPAYTSSPQNTKPTTTATLPT